jgi:nickel-dependent lactate racemase
VLEELGVAGIGPDAVAVLCPPRLFGPGRDWHAELPTTFQTVKVAVHDPANQAELAYLASTKGGRRIYLNRLLTDADQIIILGRARPDPILEYSGGLADIFPVFSDEPTRTEFLLKPTDALQGKKIWPVRQEIEEVGWLLGMPFLVEVLEGTGDEVTAVVAGGAAAVAEAMRDKVRTQDRPHMLQSVDCVVATLSGDPQRQTFAEVCLAFAHATRLVSPGGRVAVLSRGQGEFGPGDPFFRQAENPVHGLSLVRKHRTPDMVSYWELTLAASRATLYLLSDWPREALEEMFIVPLEHAGQVQKLIDDAERVAILPDANRCQAVVER